jgi:uncharacterized membrane protein
MKRIRDLLVDGLLLAIPMIVLVYLLSLALAALSKLLTAVAPLVPQFKWLGVITIDVLAIAALVAFLLALGAFARSLAGRMVSRSLEKAVLSKIPGFLLFKSVATGFTGEQSDGMKAALIHFDDNVALGFVVELENSSDDMITVFLPSAPTPAAGSVLLVQRSRVTLLDVPMAHAIGTVSRLGLGLQELVRSGLPKGQ